MNGFASTVARSELSPLRSLVVEGRVPRADDQEPASARMRRYADGETTAVHQRGSLPIEKHAYEPGTEPQRCVGLPTEIDRVRLIGELSRILHEPEVPESMKAAGLTLIGWLARRMPGEDAHALGVPSRVKKRRC